MEVPQDRAVISRQSGLLTARKDELRQTYLWNQTSAKIYSGFPSFMDGDPVMMPGDTRVPALKKAYSLILNSIRVFPPPVTAR